MPQADARRQGPTPGTLAEVIAAYHEIAAGHANLLATARTRQRYLFNGMGACVIVILSLTFRSMHGVGASLLLIACLVGLVVLIALSLARQNAIGRQERVLAFYQANLRRVEGHEPYTSRTGLEEEQNLRPAHHLYERDLDLLGPASLFAKLATVRTGLGEHGLGRYLLEPASHAEACARQEAVRELLPQTEVRERIALLGATKFQQISAGFFADWLAEEPPVFPAWCRPLLVLTASLNVALLLAALVHLRPWGFVLPNLAASLAVQGAGFGLPAAAGGAFAAGRGAPAGKHQTAFRRSCADAGRAV